MAYVARDARGLLLRFIDDNNSPARIFLLWIDSVPSALREVTALGRDFSADEEHFGGPNAVLISDRFWRTRFGGDPNAIGKKLRLMGLL
jgi:hypothetical protein